MTRMYINYEKMLGHLKTIGDTNRANTAANTRYQLGGRNVLMYWKDRKALIGGPASNDNWPTTSYAFWGHVDCSGCVFSAFFLEWTRQKGVDLSLEANRDKRPGWEGYTWWTPFGDLPNGPNKRKASAYAMGHYYDAGIEITDLKELR